jgi:histidine triad (HIT) family protein
MECLFCKIVSGEIPAKRVHENEHVVAFHDIHPQAPVHALVVPRRHLIGIHEATIEDTALLGQVMLAGRDVAEKLGLADDGYRLVVNNGVNAGQSVMHLHLHVLGGRVLAWPPG